MLAYTLLLLLSLLFSASVAAYNATDLIFLNCGDSNTIAFRNRSWNGDVRSKYLLVETSSFPATASFQDSVDRIPFVTARIFRSQLAYRFPVSPGPKFLRLYFYPATYVGGGAGDLDAAAAFFSVSANGYTLLSNFSASLTVSAAVPPDKSLIKEFIIPVRDSPEINLTFSPEPSSPFGFVNGVEILSMPENLYTSGGHDGIPRLIDSSVSFDFSNGTAFETVHRVNVGGKAVADAEDTGMFRRWVSDDDYVLNRFQSLTPYRNGVSINYTKSTPDYVAPEMVYRTSRTLGNPQNPRINLSLNLTWTFTVDAGFNYLMRLHFCETGLEVTGENQRVFSVFIGNATAVRYADVIQWSGGSGVPVFQDFVTIVPGQGRRYLWLALHPNQDTHPVYYDVILNGLELLKISKSDRSLAGLNPEPVATGNETPGQRLPEGRKHNGSHVLIVVLAVVGCILVLALGAFLFFFIRRKMREVKDSGTTATSKPKSSWGGIIYSPMSTHTNASSLPSDLCRRFTIMEIRAATDDFDEALVVGRGGFGTVYKGRINNGSTVVAIKRLDSSSTQGIHEFETEIQMLSKLRHVHLVSLIGYCDEHNEMVLVYEYMPNGTLRDHLYKKDGPSLPWKRRLEICIGAARGLQYLHTGAKELIIHRDVKTTNILLDENYVAKVSDFGLSRVGPTGTSQTHVSTVVKGSVGYVDPEYYRKQHLTEKSDVYSFGVVLFEVLCARAAMIQGLPKEQVNLVQWAKKNHSKGTIDQIIDACLTNDVTPVSLNKFSEVAYRCIHDKGVERPTMNDVVWGLEFALQLHQTAEKNKIESGGLLIDATKLGPFFPRGAVGTTDDDDDLFSGSREHVSVSTSTITSNGERGYDNSDGVKSGSVFSEIMQSKGR